MTEPRQARTSAPASITAGLGDLEGIDLTSLPMPELDRICRAHQTGRLTTRGLERVAAEISRRVGPPKTTELIEAVKAGNLERMKTLIDAGADVREMNLYAETPMSTAAARGHLDAVKLLFEAGASLGSGFEDAVYGGNLEVVGWMLDRGLREEINAAIDEDGQTVLFGPAAGGDLKMVRLLLKNGANVNLRDRDGGTAIDSAMATGRDSVVAFLLEHASPGTRRRLERRRRGGEGQASRR